MGRRYSVSSENIAVSAAQDLLQIKGASGKMLRIRSLSVGATDTTEPTAQQLELRVRFLPATVTDGSGGSTATPRKYDAGDAAASFTCLTNNTTPAATNGTAAILEEWGVHIANGLIWVFPDAETPIVGPSEAVVFELLSTVTGTVHLSVKASVEELGG